MKIQIVPAGGYANSISIILKTFALLCFFFKEGKILSIAFNRKYIFMFDTPSYFYLGDAVLELEILL